MLTVTRTSDGLAYLHIWREGEEYFRQKSQKFLTEWTNVMFVPVLKPSIENVHYVDLSKGLLDFPDHTFDAANAYHVLEHLTPQEGEVFAAEVFRVLKSNTVFRVSEPDLESICREYLRQLKLASKEPTVQNMRRYHWAVMDIFEQIVREKSGGMMLEALRAGEYDQDYLKEKYGDVFGPFLETIRQEKHSNVSDSEQRTFLQRLKHLTPVTFYQGVKWRCRSYKNRAPSHPRITREANRWMYDRVSLSRLLEKAGFVDIQQKDFKHSDIPHWSKYDLDCSNFGNLALEPSVYVEGRKPESQNPNGGRWFSR
jgi:predicted SAM-dependent methyltransferase